MQTRRRWLKSVANFVRYSEGTMAELMNPYTYQLISQKQYIATDEIHEKVRKTVESYREWRNLAFIQRTDLVRSFVEGVLEDKQILKPLIAEQIGKSYRDIDSEFQRVRSIVPELIALGSTSLEPSIVGIERTRLKKIMHEPVGVSMIFPYFSEPIFDSLIHLVPCLISGGGALVKPSDFNPFLGNYLQSKAKMMLRQPSLVTQLYIEPAQLPLVAAIRNVKKVIYSGSQGSAKHIFETFVEGRFVDCNLFFGGQDAAYVDPSADLALAAQEISKHAFYNNGQSYDCIKRLYIHQSIESEFVSLLKEQMSHFILGNPTHSQTHLGPLTAQQSCPDIENIITEAVDEGAVCQCGGLIRTDGYETGLFVEPTLLTHCENNMRIMQIQINAPILCAIPVRSKKDFVIHANENCFGTGVRIFTRELQQYYDVIDALRVGRIVFNSGTMLAKNLPIEGWKQSGKGKILSELSYEQYTIPKSYNIREL